MRTYRASNDLKGLQEMCYIDLSLKQNEDALAEWKASDAA